MIIKMNSPQTPSPKYYRDLKPGDVWGYKGYHTKYLKTEAGAIELGGSHRRRPDNDFATEIPAVMYDATLILREIQ